MAVVKETLVVRRARHAEIGSIASILRRAFQEFRPLYTPEAYALTTPDSKAIEQRWLEGPVWVAMLAGKLVGTVAAVPNKGSLYIRSMAVLPQARGKGIGRLLLAEVEREAIERGYRRMLLSTTPFLHAAIRLYEQFGFQKTLEGPHDLAGTPLIGMEKRLADSAAG